MEYTIRELVKQYLDKNDFFETLKNLREVGNLTKEQAEKILETINKQNSHIYIAITDDNKIIGALTLIIEQKFIRQGGKCGHIEDVSTRKGFEGKGIGSSLVKHAIQKAKQENCYKIILDCSDENIPFYEKQGFKRYENCMRLDL